MGNLRCYGRFTGFGPLKERRFVFQTPPGESAPPKIESGGERGNETNKNIDKKLEAARNNFQENKDKALVSLAAGLHSPVPAVSKQAEEQRKKISDLNINDVDPEEIDKKTQEIKKILAEYGSYLKLDVTRHVVKVNAAYLKDNYKNNVTAIRNGIVATHAPLPSSVEEELNKNLKASKSHIDSLINEKVNSMVKEYMELPEDQLLAKLADLMEQDFRVIEAQLTPGDNRTSLANDLDLVVSGYEKESRELIFDSYKDNAEKAKICVKNITRSALDSIDNYQQNVPRPKNFSRVIMQVRDLESEAYHRLDDSTDPSNKKTLTPLQILTTFQTKIDEAIAFTRANRYTLKDSSLPDHNRVLNDDKVSS